MDLLLHAEAEPPFGRAFERECQRLRRLALGFLVAGLACGGAVLKYQIDRAPENEALFEAYESVERGRRALNEGRYEVARDELRRGVDAGSTSEAAWIWLADCERKLGREDEARKAEGVARKKGVTDPRLRIRLDP